jgi:hypothetical protein
MQNDPKRADAPGAGATATPDDLSAAIEGSIDKQPGEEVRTVRVYGDHYRCNWWIRDITPGPAYLHVGRITRSKFLHVTRKGDDLVIVDLSNPA